MKLKNNYNECLTNLACSISKYFGVSYKDYLGLLLVMQAEKMEKYKRMMDLMEANEISQLLVEDNGSYAGVVHIHDLIKEGII